MHYASTYAPWSLVRALLGLGLILTHFHVLLRSILHTAPYTPIKHHPPTHLPTHLPACLPALSRQLCSAYYCPHLPRAGWCLAIECGPQFAPSLGFGLIHVDLGRPRRMHPRRARPRGGYGRRPATGCSGPAIPMGRAARLGLDWMHCMIVAILGPCYIRIPYHSIRMSGHAMRMSCHRRRPHPPTHPPSSPDTRSGPWSS